MKSLTGVSLAVVSMLACVPLVCAAQGHDRDHRRDHARQWHGDIRHFESYDLHQWRTGRWHEGRHAGRFGWWWIMGGVWYFYPQPVYPYPDPYLPPTVIIQQPVPAMTLPSAPAVATPPPAPVWYYCEASGGYYPYVPTCPAGWKAMPAAPQEVPQ